MPQTNSEKADLAARHHDALKEALERRLRHLVQAAGSGCYQAYRAVKNDVEDCAVRAMRVEFRHSIAAILEDPDSLPATA